MKCMTTLRTRIWNQPLHSLGLALSLALGMLVFVTFETIRYEIVLKPLPLRKPEQLVQVKLVDLVEGRELELDYFTYEEFFQWRNNSTSFECLTAVQDGGKNNFVDLQRLGQSERLSTARVASDFFHCIGLAPRLGGSLSFKEGAGSNEVFLSSGLWARNYGHARDLLDKRIVLERTPYRVTGVLPRSFSEETVPIFQKSIHLWFPVSDHRMKLGGRAIRVFGRLKPGCTLTAARQELAALLGRSADTRSGLSVRVVKLQDEVTKQARPTLAILLTSGAIIALLTCSNAVSLLFAGNVTRAKDISILKALGASPLRLTMDSLVEGLAISCLAGIFSSLSLAWAVRLCTHFLPSSLPRQAGIEVTMRPFLCIAVLSVVTGLVLGVFGALKRVPEDFRDALREGCRSVSFQRSRRLLHVVNAQIVLAIVLLTGAGLVLRSYHRASRIEPGMQLQNVLVFDLFLPAHRSSGEDGRSMASFFEDLKSRLAALPQVKAVALTSSVPLRNRDYFYHQWRLRKVDDKYFSLLQIPFLQGHGFEAPRSYSGQYDIVINQSLARRLFGDSVPIGAIWNDKYKIVGVVRDSMHEGMEAKPQPAVYMNHIQQPDDRMSILIRTSVPPRQLVSAVRHLIWSTDPDLPVSNVSTLEDLALESESQARRKLFLRVLGTLSVVSLLLASIGVYGVLNLFMVQRRKEYSIRMALGAKWSQIVGLELRRVYGLVISGVGVGLMLASVGALFLSNILFEISPFDIQAYVGAISIIVLAVLVVTIVNLGVVVRRAAGRVLVE